MVGDIYVIPVVVSFGVVIVSNDYGNLHLLDSTHVLRTIIEGLFDSP